MSAPESERESPRPAPLAASIVRLHIERVVLEGVPLDAWGAGRLEAALTAELTGALQRSAPDTWTGGSVARVVGPALDLRDRAPDAMGRAIARGVARAIAPSTREAACDRP